MQYFRLPLQPAEHQKKYDCPGSGKQDLANKISSSLWVRHSNQDDRASYSRSESEMQPYKDRAFQAVPHQDSKGIGVTCRTIALVWTDTEAWEGEEQAGGGKLFAICSS